MRTEVYISLENKEIMERRGYLKYCNWKPIAKVKLKAKTQGYN